MSYVCHDGLFLCSTESGIVLENIVGTVLGIARILLGYIVEKVLEHIVGIVLAYIVEIVFGYICRNSDEIYSRNSVGIYCGKVLGVYRGKVLGNIGEIVCTCLMLNVYSSNPVWKVKA